MGICKDPATTYLQRLGFNVIRHPDAGLAPMKLVGRRAGETRLLGDLQQLIEETEQRLPEWKKDIEAAEISGQSTSSLKASLGIQILGDLIGALGGNIGVKAAYEQAKRVTFTFGDVVKDRVMPLDVGQYLCDAEIDFGNKVLREYVLGSGQLFVITEIVKSKSFTVEASSKSGGSLELEVPVVNDLVGAEVEVSGEAETSSKITYDGKDRLPFGFQVFEIGVDNGDLRVFSAAAGSVPMSVDPAKAAPDLNPTLLAEDQLIEFTD